MGDLPVAVDDEIRTSEGRIVDVPVLANDFDPDDDPVRVVGVGQGLHGSVFINGDETVEPVGVRVGRGIGDWIVVEGPLEPGARVVTRGNERLQPGQPVEGSLLEYAQP